MTEHVDAALFVYSGEGRHLIEKLGHNPYGVAVTPVEFDTLMQDPGALLEGTGHVVVAGTLAAVRAVLALSLEYGFGVGLIPLPTQKELARSYALPGKGDAAMDLALRRDAPRMDLIRCNGRILLYKATLGRLPLLDSLEEDSPSEIVVKAVKRFVGLRLLPFTFTTAGKQKIRTAACGCMIVQRRMGNLASRIVARDTGASDGRVVLIISAPLSIVEYLRFVIQSLNRFVRQKQVPAATGYIKSREIHIESGVELDVSIDGEKATKTPLHCEALPRAVRVNVGGKLRREIRASSIAKESVHVTNLPRGKEELTKAKKKAIPFFSYASDERFRDLFRALRVDARMDIKYMVLMVLSTVLATVGLYQSSSAVVIGAMLLAPLMAPIVSLAMGMLRGDRSLEVQSTEKIIWGVLVALSAAALITLLFPHKPLTPEMQARLNPTLLDLAVAIFAGTAGAYTKAYKEILSSLAGVAIAVALVPPLAVAGIGIGRLDFHFFSQALLLFSTNLVGIVLAATYTFRVLGYSPAVRRRMGIRLVLLSLALITIPLYLSYGRIVDKLVMERSWQQERFLVNGKYIIVQKADLNRYRGRVVLVMHILAREQLSREDFSRLRRKVQADFDQDLVLRVNIVYIP